MVDCCGNFSMCGPNCVTPALGCFPGDPGWTDEDVRENDEPCMCGTPFTCLADEHPGFGEDS